MAWGPKSAKRRARSARDIKSFAQKMGASGEQGLVDIVASAIAASLPSGIAEELVVANARAQLIKRGLSPDSVQRILTKAMAEVERAFKQA